MYDGDLHIRLPHIAVFRLLISPQSVLEMGVGLDAIIHHSEGRRAIRVGYRNAAISAIACHVQYVLNRSRGGILGNWNAADTGGEGSQWRTFILYHSLN